MDVNVKDVCGENCVTVHLGEKLANVISSSLSSNTDVTLDFNGVLIFASPFFNSLLGSLFQQIGAEKIMKLLHTTHMDSTGLDTMQRVIKNLEVTSENPAQRQAQIDAIKKLVEESDAD